MYYRGRIVNTFSSSLIDYKVYCLGGKPEVIRVYYNRASDHVFVETYDKDWDYMPNKDVYSNQYRSGGGQIVKPQLLGVMLNCAEDFAFGFPEVRVDFYIVNNKFFWGEMTFTSNGGTITSFTNEFLHELGDKVPLVL